MNPGIDLKHEFVEFIPDELEQGTLYISMRFATASHLCCCGCGNKVVTPIRPTDWQITFDGKKVSLHPSIGNWSFPCQSHYWIRNNQVQWAPKWSCEQIESVRRHDSHAKDGYFGAADPASGNVIKDDTDKETARPSKRGIWQAMKEWFS